MVVKWDCYPHPPFPLLLHLSHPSHISHLPLSLFSSPLPLPHTPLSQARRTLRPRRHRRRRIRSNSRRIRARHRRRLHRTRITVQNIQEPAGSTKLLLIARTEHIAIVRSRRDRGTRKRRPTITLLRVLHTRIILGSLLASAKGHAGFDRHAGLVRVCGSGEQSAGAGFFVASLAHIGANALDGGGRDVGREIIHAQSGTATTDLRRVARASHVAARVANCRVRLQGVTAEAFFAELETREAVVIGVAEGLAGLDGHGCGVSIGGLVEGARVGFVGAAEVDPAVSDCLAGGWGEGCGGGGGGRDDGGSCVWGGGC